MLQFQHYWKSHPLNNKNVKEAQKDDTDIN